MIDAQAPDNVQFTLLFFLNQIQWLSLSVRGLINLIMQLLYFEAFWADGVFGQDTPIQIFP